MLGEIRDPWNRLTRSEGASRGVRATAAFAGFLLAAALSS
jgi:hypothetical protein